MYGNDSFLVAEQGTNFIRQIIQCVLMFSKNNELFTLTICAKHFFIILKQPGQFFPLAVNAADANLIRHLFQALQRFDFRFQLSDRCCSRSVVNDLLLHLFLLIGWKVIVIEIIEVFGEVHCSFAKPFFCKAMLQTFPPSAE